MPAAAGTGASPPPPPQPVNTVALVLLFVAALCVMLMLFRNFPTVAESVQMGKHIRSVMRSLNESKFGTALGA